MPTADAQATPRPEAARYPGIDATRAVAGLAVLVSHLTQTLTWRIPGWEAAAGPVAGPVHAFTGTAGAWGVGLFLVVSGACIHSRWRDGWGTRARRSTCAPTTGGAWSASTRPTSPPWS